MGASASIKALIVLQIAGETGNGQAGFRARTDGGFNLPVPQIAYQQHN